MKKLLAYILLKDPLMVLLRFSIEKLVGPEAGKSFFGMEEIMGATFFVGISLIVWDLILLSIPYFLFVKNYAIAKRFPFILGLILHLPAVFITLLGFEGHPYLLTICLISTGISGLIYKALSLKALTHRFNNQACN